MRQLRQTLRLHLEAHLSLRECARVLGISKTTVGAIVSMARVAGVDWAVAQGLNDDELWVLAVAQGRELPQRSVKRNA